MPPEMLPQLMQMLMTPSGAMDRYGQSMQLANQGIGGMSDALNAYANIAQVQDRGAALAGLMEYLTALLTGPEEEAGSRVLAERGIERVTGTPTREPTGEGRGVPEGMQTPLEPGRSGFEGQPVEDILAQNLITSPVEWRSTQEVPLNVRLQSLFNYLGKPYFTE